MRFFFEVDFAAAILYTFLCKQRVEDDLGPGLQTACMTETADLIDSHPLAAELFLFADFHIAGQGYLYLRDDAEMDGVDLGGVIVDIAAGTIETQIFLSDADLFRSSNKTS